MEVSMKSSILFTQYILVGSMLGYLCYLLYWAVAQVSPLPMVPIVSWFAIFPCVLGFLFGFLAWGFKMLDRFDAAAKKESDPYSPSNIG